MGNIPVNLKQSAGATVNSTFTNGDGDFEFDGLTSGNFVIDIELKGYEPVRQNVEIRSGSQPIVVISMNRSAVIVNPASGVTISAHQLSVPHKAHDEYEKGMELLYGKSDYPAAIAVFNRAITDFPTYYEAYADMGNAYLRLREMALAEQALRKSVDLSSGRYREALTILAGLLSSLNRFQEAVPFARKIVEIDSSSWEGPFELARALIGLKQTEEAEKSATQARDMNPDNAPVYLMLANIHIQREDYPALLKDLESFLKLEPAGPDADQARKLHDDLQAGQRQAEQRPAVDAQGRPMVGAGSPTSDSEQSLEPDSSGLPSLPPPAPANP